MRHPEKVLGSDPGLAAHLAEQGIIESPARRPASRSEKRPGPRRHARIAGRA